MAIQFFDTEFGKVTERFNSVYGNRYVFDKTIKGSLVLSITYLGILVHRIRKNKRKEDIQQFVKRKDIINKFLDYAEEQFKVQDRKALVDVKKARAKSA
jgi:hypothetical protein